MSAELVTLSGTRLPAHVPARAVARNRRRVLCVFPRYTHSFGTFDHAFPIVGVKAFMPPQGLLVVAAYLPECWEVRLVDENVQAVTAADLRWADVVFLSGMHVQREHILALNRRAQAAGKLTVLGGPSVSACPEWYPEVDLLHVGELGDATRALVARLDAGVERPPVQERYETRERLEMSRFPLPAYGLLRLPRYFLGSVQFSSGCPYVCEFCDIPELYGRVPRLKAPEQVLAELDAMVAGGLGGAVYFVDDNFIGNRKAAVELLRALVRWQEERGFPVQFACEATLNLAGAPEVLELMREANFGTVFCGIETPEEHALSAIQKKQNLRRPLLEAVRTINRYGIEVVSGIIIGLDTDTETTGERILEFIEESGIPLLTINLLHALPRTPLWRRLEREGRLREGPSRGSNLRFLLPEEVVIGMWRECVTRAYAPERVFARFARQQAETYPYRRKLPPSPTRANPRAVRRGLGMLARLIWRAGVLADYRAHFWRMALPALRRLEIEQVIHVGVVAHHLIQYARECERGEGELCFYGAAPVEPGTATRKQPPHAPQRAGGRK